MKNSKISREKMLFTDTSSIYSEAFQNLQVNLDFSFIDSQEKVCAITSGTVSEGKSTIAANLAYVCAKKDYKVLLIDLDLRSSTINRFFKLDNVVGIVDYCAGKAKKEDIIKKYENLDIVTSGTKSPFPSKILESQALYDFIEEAKEKYDYIFIDTPPVLVTTDALSISKFVNRYLLVVKYGHTKKSDFDEVIRQFANSKLEISGVVFDSISIKNNKYYGKYSYGEK